MRHFLLLACFLSSWAFAQQTQLEYLSGTSKDQTVDWEFYIDRGMKSGQWSTIPVPSNWELQGFGVYNYGRGQQPESDETATYRHRFEVPRAWQRNHHINLVFEGVMTDTEAKINGKVAGPVHQGSFYRFKYDVTDLLRFGRENQLEVKVKNWSDNPSVNSAERAADYWLFGGIYRPVYLEVLPEHHIEWTAIDAKHTGGFTLLAHSQHFGPATALEAEVQTLTGERVGEPLRTTFATGDTTAKVEGTFPGIEPWSAEFPHRYQVVVKILAGEEVLHERTDKFGFRTVELRERDGLYVNGARVILKGANRHSFWPESGRCLSPEISVADVNLIKDMNMNAVRMSHYPPDAHFLDACDSLGLYVLDELAGWQTMYDSTLGMKLVKEMIIRDVNHPSVIIWDNGNEGGGNHAIDDQFHRYDPQQRPLIHPWKKFRGTDTQHYKDYDCCVDGLWHGNRVFFPTEFLHGLYDGGHGAGLEDHWKAMVDHPLAAGGFLWALVDEAVHRRDKNDSLDAQGSNGPDGIVGPYREKEGSFFAIKEIWSPVYIPDFYLTEHWDGRIELENRYSHTPLDQVKFSYEWGRFPAAGLKEAPAGDRATMAREAKAPEIAPGGQGSLELPLPADWQQQDFLALTATDPHGRELWTWTWPIKHPAEVYAVEKPVGEAAVSARRAGNAYVLEANGLTARIAVEDGRLLGLEKNGRKLSLEEGPVAVYDTLAIDSVWLDAEQRRVYVRSLRARGQGWMDWHWEMDPAGLLGLEVQHLPRQGHYDLLGVSFQYPEEKVEGITYLGRGPYRVYKNRLRGGTLGGWEKAYNDTRTGQDWDYPEFKGFHQDLYWAKLQTEEGTLQFFTETENLFLHLFTPSKPTMAYNEHTDGIYPQTGNLSFLNAISSIGTKFKRAAQLGPQGQKNMFFYHGGDPMPLSVKLWFGVE